MDVSIAICTWNRAQLLESTLDTLRGLSIPPGTSYEVLVVNNNSTDDTAHVLNRFAGTLPLRAVFEPIAGHSNARNRAVAEARGDLIVWTDDDVLVDPGWIRGYVEAAAADREVAFFAGPVEPWFESRPPKWMTRHMRSLSGVIVCVDHGPEARPLVSGDALFGANMAVRRDVARLFPFDTRLGRQKDVLIGGDDTEFVERLIAAGHRCAWVPGARLRHFVPRSRTSAAYVRRWFHDAGRTVVRRSGGLAGPFIGGVPRWALRDYVRETLTAWITRPLGNAQWFRAYRQSLILGGMLQESRRNSTERSRTLSPSVQ